MRESAPLAALHHGMSYGWLVAALLAVSTCSTRPVDEEDCVPAPPERGIAVNYGDPCDFSQGSRASAKDEGCGYYECIRGAWREGSGLCQRTIIEPLVGSGGAKYCAPECLAELDPTTPGLDAHCSMRVEGMVGQNGVTTIGPQDCLASADGWALPPGETYCLALTTIDGEGAMRVDDECVSRGVNAGFEIIGDVAAVAAPGFTITVYCNFEVYPQEPCPHAGEFVDPYLCE